MSTEKIKIKDLPSKESILQTDIFVESDKLSTYKVTAEDIAEYVSESDSMKNKYVEQTSIGVKDGIVPLNSDKKIDGSYIQYGTTSSTVYEGSAGKILETNLDNHILNESNPHNVTKVQVGLGNVENKSSATIRGEITKSNVTTALGYTPYTPNEVDNKLSALETNIDWKESVATYSDIATTYPNPVDGWTVNVKDTDYTYRYNGISWVVISANAIPKATNGVDGLLSKEDHTNYEDANSKKHTHSNKSVIDGISSTNVSNWNAAKTHADSAHAPSNAQANVIETVKVNGTALTPTSKSVNITVPTNVSDLTNDSGYTTNKGTITGIKMNGTSKGTSGVVDLGTVITAHQDISGKSDVGHKHTKSEITDFPTSMTPTAHNQASNTINAMTGYSKPTSTSAISTSDTLNTAIGKLEKALENKGSSSFSGSYNDLSDKPTIPSVGNGTITIKQSGTTKGTFTTNQSGDTTIELTDNNTHYASGTIVNNSATATANTTSALTNGNVYLNHIENGTVKNSHKISGSGATTVTTDTSGNIIINSTGGSSGGSSVSFTQNLTSGTKVGTLTIDGTATDLYAPTDTNTKVTQTVTTSNASYPLLLAPSGQTATATTTSYFDSGVTLNPSTNTIVANVSGSSASSTTATKWATARNINGMSVQGDANRANYGTCSTAAATVEKTVACTGYALVANVSEITVKFTVTNTASNPTLNVNGTGSKPIYYRGSAISAGYLAANRTYLFRYNGTQYDLVGDINTDTNTKNTAGSTNTSSKIFLIGATSQAANPQTYSHDTVYVGTDGCLYSNSKRIVSEVISSSEPTGLITGDHWLKEF